ncbi:MAG: hypothetical protein KC517_05685 [Bacteroidetes bacterium]|nr:hypothetical protein [Bacteroidota bacterium]
MILNKTSIMNRFAAFVVIGTMVFTVGCERVTEPEGPNLTDLYGDFTVLEDFKTSQDDVDFSANETVYFSARFSTITSWTITIKSSTSDATKIIEGRSNLINEENGTWDGSTTIFPSFGTGACTVELWTEADSSKQNANVNVTGLRVPNGTVVADFEAINPDWNIFAQSGANMSFKLASDKTVPQGSRYFDMGGAVNWDWLIGLIDFPAKSVGPNGFGLSSNPNESYFNVALYRPDTITNGVVLFQFKEDENGDGNFNEANEDMYSVELKGLDAGWQIVSIKYSDMVALENGQPTAPKGNGLHNPDKLEMISCLFLANPSSGYSQALMDYMIFTTDGPLKL